MIGLIRFWHTKGYVNSPRQYTEIGSPGFASASSRGTVAMLMAFGRSPRCVGSPYSGSRVPVVISGVSSALLTSDSQSNPLCAPRKSLED